MTLCWIANSDISSRLTITAPIGSPTAPESIVFGTPIPVTKPIA
jgi:hypothetical protein